MTWIKFHGELRKGTKRGLSRATRFVYLELSHEARAGRGVIELPRGLSDLEAVHDILGGNAKELKTALDDLSSEEFDMISFDVADGRRRLVVTSWDKWNSVDETASLRRDRHMARKAATQRVTNGKGSRSGTPPDRDRICDRIGDRNAIVTRLDQIRGDQNPQTPVPGASDFSPEPDPDDPEPRAKALAALATLSAQTAPFLPEGEP